jgi:uncharacterized protein (DUF58 family)
MKNPGRVLFLGMLAIGVLGAAATGAAVYMRLIYTALFVGGGAWIWAFFSVRGMSVRRQTRMLRANVGDLFEEHFDVTNVGRMLRLWVEVVNESPLPGGTGSRLLTSVGARQKRSYVARTWLVRRGAFPLGPTMLASGDPFGLFRAQKRVPAGDSLLVLPLLVDIAAFPSPPGLLPGGKAIRRKSLAVTPHASGIREYIPGDPMKRIHWPSTARRGELMVKEFEQDPQAEIWVFLDAQESVQAELPYKDPQTAVDFLFRQRPSIKLPPSTMEYSVCIGASLAHYFIRQRRAVGLVSAGRVFTVIPAERSERQENKILETLAFEEGVGRLSLAAVLGIQAKQLPLGSSVILITPSGSQDIVLAVEDLQRRNLHPIVVLLDGRTFGGSAGSERLTEMLTERNVPVCRISLGDDLAQALTKFSAEFSDEESNRWQIPLSSLWI